MGLAYNLDTLQNPYLTSGLSNYFVQFPNFLQWRINFGQNQTFGLGGTTVGAPNIVAGPLSEGLGGGFFPQRNVTPTILGNPAPADPLIFQPSNVTPQFGANIPQPPDVRQLPTCFFTQANTSMTNDNGWLLRWCGRPGTAGQWTQSIFPTGEFIIRDITFVNGYYAIVGSYKARFMGLYNNFLDANNYADTWDGFLMMYRAYSDNSLVPFDSSGKPVSINQYTGQVEGSNGFNVSNSGIGILPMRMPYNILPHDDRLQAPDLDDVGLYTVDVWRETNQGDNRNVPGGGTPNGSYAISLWLGGTQAVAKSELSHTVTGVAGGLGIPYSNIDRLAYAMVGTFANLGYKTQFPLGNGQEVSTQTDTISTYENIGLNDITESGGDIPNAYAVKSGEASVLVYDTRASDVLIMAYSSLPNQGIVSYMPTQYTINNYAEVAGGLRGAYPPFSAYIWPQTGAGGGLATDDYYIFDSQGLGVGSPNGVHPYLQQGYISNYSWGRAYRSVDDGGASLGNTVNIYASRCTIDGGGGGLQTLQVYCNNQWSGPRFYSLNSNLAGSVQLTGALGEEYTLDNYYTQGYFADGVCVLREDRNFQPPRLNSTAYNANVYMKCIYDIQAFTEWTRKNAVGADNLAQSPCFMAGNCWVGTDDPTDPIPLAKVYPTSISAVYPTIYTNEFATDYPAAIAWPLCDDTPGLGSQVNMPYETGQNNIESVAFAPQAELGGYGPFMMMESTVVNSFVVNAAGGGSVGVAIPPNTLNTIKNDGGGTNWAGNATALRDAYFAFVTVPYEEMGYDTSSGAPPTPDPSGTWPLIYFFCNNITYLDGTVGTGIFQLFQEEGFPFGRVGYVHLGMFFNSQKQGGTMTPIPITMPNKWTGKIVQTRTFTQGEEDASRSLADVPRQGNFTSFGNVQSFGFAPQNNFSFTTGTGPGSIKPDIVDGQPAVSEGAVVINSRNNEQVGVKGNYPRLGLEPTPEGEVAPTQFKQQGKRTGEGMGATGWVTTGTDRRPIVLVFDSGGGLYTGPDYDPVVYPIMYSPQYNYSNALQNRGNKFNQNIVKDPDSNKRIALGCSWDNDRDQWLFVFANYTSNPTTNGCSIVSSTSTFTDTARFGSAYLDQTSNFLDKGLITGAPTEFNNLKYCSFPMTNNLDGLMFFACANDTSSGFTMSDDGKVGDASSPQINPLYVKVTSSTTLDNTRLFYPNSSNGSGGVFRGRSNIQDPVAGAVQTRLDFPTASTTIWPSSAPYLPSTIKVFNLDGSTGREAFVWVDYILFDGADAVIATKLRERGMKVSIDSVEWFKRKIINSGDLNIKAEEIEMWMRQQQDEFTMMMRDAERMGRVRKRKKQVSAYALDMLESINTDFEDKEVQEFMKDYLPKSRPPTPEEEMIERQQKGGYSPQSKSYFDEVFEQ